MSYKKCILIRNSYDCSSNEQERMEFKGKQVKCNLLSQEYSYAFKVEESLMRMDITKNGEVVEIKQIFSSASSSMKLELNKKHIYTMTISTGHSLEFIVEASEIFFSKDIIRFKYRLLDKNKEDLISLNEISISEEK